VTCVGAARSDRVWIRMKRSARAYRPAVRSTNANFLWSSLRASILAVTAPAFAYNASSLNGLRDVFANVGLAPWPALGGGCALKSVSRSPRPPLPPMTCIERRLSLPPDVDARRPAQSTGAMLAGGAPAAHRAGPPATLTLEAVEPAGAT